MPAFDPGTRERLVRVVTENPLFLSKLLNRELPPELNEACVAENIHIFPRRWDDLKGSCSCPDWAVPCKHIAAVLYLVANEIDKNPFGLFAARRPGGKSDRLRLGSRTGRFSRGAAARTGSPKRAGTALAAPGIPVGGNAGPQGRLCAANLFPAR